MIYELRNYTAQPGRLRDLLARFENHTNRIWARYGIRPGRVLDDGRGSD